MPVNDHLKAIVVSDFSGGLNDGNDFLVPADQFQSMIDCYPRGENGLRAFFKPSTTLIPTTNIDLTTEYIEMVVPLITSTGTMYFAATKNRTTGLQKWYTMAIGGSTWTLRKTFTAPVSLANSSLTQCITYYTGAAVVFAICTSHNKSDGSEDGLYTISQAGAVTFVEASIYNSVSMVQYQARLMYAKLNTIVWTNEASIAVPAAENFLTLQTGVNDARDIIAIMVPYAPSTLLVATLGSGWWMIEGDIEDPIVRQMGDDHYPGVVQRGCRTEDGIVFFEPNNGIYKTRNMGANFERQDPTLIPHAYDDNQAFTYFDNFVFAPGGKVHHTDSGAWFSLSHATGSTVVNHWERQSVNELNGLALTQQVIGPQRSTTGAILSYPVNEYGGQRMETYTVKTAPMRDENGKQVQIREVQVGVNCFGSASTVAVTVGSTTRTTSALAAGKNVISFLFSERAEYQDVQVVPNSNTTNVEAPILEFIRPMVREDTHAIRY